MASRTPPSSSSCRATLALASLLALFLLLFCSTASQARPHGPRGRRFEEQQQKENDDAPQMLAASDAKIAAPSPAPTLALLLAPAPAPSKSVGLLQEARGKGAAAAAAPSPSAANPAAAAALSRAGAEDDNEGEEEEEASSDFEEGASSSDDGAGPDGQEAAPESSEDEPEADVAEKVASAYRAPSAAAEPPAVPGQPKKVKFLARGANKEIDQSEVDPSSLSGDKGSFVFYGRYCGPGWTDKQNRPGIDAVDEACHSHDTCYGKAHDDNPPSHKIRGAAAECSCDKALVAALKDFKKNKTEQASATKAAKRAADDMVKLFDVKCPISVVGAALRPPPSPESAPGKW